LGLLVASLFSTTLSMTSSDANTISSVITRDILPVFSKRVKQFDRKKMLSVARITTFSFIFMTIVVAFNAQSFGGVIGLIISWFAALLGPISIPMILGLLPLFKRSGSTAALLSIVGGLLTFVGIKLFGDLSIAWELAGPLLTSLFLYVVYALVVRRPVPAKVEELVNSLDQE